MIADDGIAYANRMSTLNKVKTRDFAYSFDKFRKVNIDDGLYYCSIDISKPNTKDSSCYKQDTELKQNFGFWTGPTWNNNFYQPLDAFKEF